MTKDEMIKKIAELEAGLVAEKAKGANMKTKVMAQLESGVNTMSGLTEGLNTTSKNISSILTYLRKDLIKEGKTIITQKYKDQTMVTILSLETLGWK